MKTVKNKLYNKIPEEVMEYLVSRIVSKLQEYESVILSMLEQSSLNKNEVTVELVKRMLNKLVSNIDYEATIDNIKKVVCSYYRESINDVFSLSRKQNLVKARQTTMYFVKRYTSLSLAEVGRCCGDRDHATVLHACRSIERMRIVDNVFRKELNDIDKILRNL